MRKSFVNGSRTIRAVTRVLWSPLHGVLLGFLSRGNDPLYRRSLCSSAALHLLVIVLIPLLLRLGGCVNRYRIPGGGAKMVVQKVKIVEREKIRKRYILRPDSAIIFQAPDLDDSKVFKEVVEQTKLTYVADPNAAHGKAGAGQGGPAGFPNGFRDGVVRFIRLEYGGQNWDDGMDSLSRADMNFLDKFKAYTGIRTAKHSESHPIRLLKKYPKGEAPPFVYMTGSGEIHIPGADIGILRQYLLDGGMLFADCGSPAWDWHFRGFMAVLFPGNGLRVVSDDDPIFQTPFVFPNGAPPLWHHGGNSSMGIKHQGRWVVFYHPGDVNDAWKTGHSGLSADLATRAHELGINILYYAVVHYLEATRQYRE